MVDAAALLQNEIVILRPPGKWIPVDAVLVAGLVDIHPAQYAVVGSVARICISVQSLVRYVLTKSAPTTLFVVPVLPLQVVLRKLNKNWQLLASLCTEIQ